MALARIITRSNACSRELALDLLGRGYAVEIVSPDSVPDDLADLELRVEEDPGNQLVASVEAHNGEHTASLEFLHYLKAPMPDFVRRPPELHEAAHSPEKPVSFHVEHCAEDVELPANAPQLAPETVSPAAEILHDPKLDSKEGARPILPPDQSPSLSVEPPGREAIETATLAQPLVVPTTVRPKREPPWHDRSAGWFWRTALALAVVVLLALVLALGMRWTGEASAAQSSGAPPAEKSAGASTDVNLLSAPVAERVPERVQEKDPGEISALAVLPPAIKPAGNSDRMPKESQVAKAGAAPSATATMGSGATVPRRHGDGLIARDTVTYFHQRTLAEAASRAGTSQRFAVQHRSSRKHDDVIAANTVTLNEKPAPKPAKPDSGVKHYSDLK